MKTISLLKLATFLLASVPTLQSAHAQNLLPEFSSQGVIGNQTTRPFYVVAAREGVPGAYIEMINNTSSDANRAGSIGYIAGYNAVNPAGVSHDFYSRKAASGDWTSLMRVLQNGQVQIGERTPTNQPGYKLSVSGKLVAQSLYVTNPGDWADFVFAPTYRCMPLAELETYLQRNKHLPALPSATEVAAKGYSMSEMDTKLLQSVEELTLHVIALNKELQQLKAEKTSTK